MPRIAIIPKIETSVVSPITSCRQFSSHICMLSRRDISNSAQSEVTAQLLLCFGCVQLSVQEDRVDRAGSHDGCGFDRLNKISLWPLVVSSQSSIDFVKKDTGDTVLDRISHIHLSCLVDAIEERRLHAVQHGLGPTKRYGYRSDLCQGFQHSIRRNNIQPSRTHLPFLYITS